VDNIQLVDFKKRSFDGLVLDDKYKDILKAMVANHVSQSRHKFNDLVAGKGQGLVISLHGRHHSRCTLKYYANVCRPARSW